MAARALRQIFHAEDEVPALPEAARLLSTAYGVPTLRTPDLQNKRQTAEILTSHQDLTITSAAARPHPPQRQGVSRLACRPPPANLM